MIRSRSRCISVKRSGWRLAAIGLAFAWMMLPGCGYKMAGSGSLPGGVRTVTVHTLENRTGETDLAVKVTNALIAELNRRGKKVLAANQQPDATLDGTLISLSKRTISRSNENTSLERRVSLRISLTLTHADGRVLWQRKDIVEDQAYAVNDAATSATEAELGSALDQLAQRLAETVARQLTETF